MESRKPKRVRTSLRNKSEAIRVLNLIRESVHSTTALGRISTGADSEPFRVLISTILSARTRDPVTEAASERLFEVYPDAKSLSNAPPAKVASLIRPVSFYNNKASNIIAAAKRIVEEHDGRVPRNYEALLNLPGVGRKTANCVLVYGFSEPAIPVDVHVHRISNRIGLVDTNKPEETEEALASLYDRKYWLDVNELMVSFGQTICRPVRPKCETCTLNSVCRYYSKRPKASG